MTIGRSPIWTSNSLSKALGMEVHAGIAGNSLQFNSRDVSEGDVFIALKGENGDGHQYVQDALSRGAACTIVSQKIEADPLKLILVDDTFVALQKLAEYKRRLSKAKFIGITGSLGKTSTKEAVAAIARHNGKSMATRGNFNNHIGVPLDLASMPDDLEYVVIEMGMDRPGEISYLSKLVKPDVAVITNVAQAHLVFFGSERGIADAKCEMFDGMQDGAIILLNLDNPHYQYCADKASSLKVLSFGTSFDTDYRVSDYSFDGKLAHMHFTVSGIEYKAATSLTGRHMATNLAAALGIADSLGFATKKSIEAIKDLTPKRGRGERIELDLDGKTFMLIHDCYNAGPLSVKAALDQLKETKHPNKIAILADMRWLGDDEVAHHLDLEEYVKVAGLKKLYTVGDLMLHLHKKTKDAIDGKHFNDSDDLKQEILDLIEPNSLVLMKGSLIMRLPDVADYLISKGSIV